MIDSNLGYKILFDHFSCYIKGKNAPDEIQGDIFELQNHSDVFV